MISGLASVSLAGDYIYLGAMRETLRVGPMLSVVPVVAVVGGLLGGFFSRLVLGFGRANGFF